MGRPNPSGFWGVTNRGEADPAPCPDEVELTLLGPGYGESVVVHIGQGRWVIVDSCITDAREPQALDYLLSIGVDPAAAVTLIVATHWHDDHIRGMAKLVDACPNAEFSCAAALRREEFLAAIHALNRRGAFAATSGVRELHTVFGSLAEQGRVPRFAIADRPLFAAGQCVVCALSPHDDEFVRFLQSIGTLFPQEGQTNFRVPDVSPNHLAVVLWVQVHDVAVLLGADLERAGWVKILDSPVRTQTGATAFKVPHHGAASAYEPRIWREMLDPNPVAVLTPWRRGGHVLPSPEDVRCLLGETDNAFVTSAVGRTVRPRRRDRAIERSIREANIRLRRIVPQRCGLRLRHPTHPGAVWSVERFGDASHLADLVA